ncbi:MAG TPA: VCBS repeat-containing protein [Planctomycetota bacterium]|nr:VCBS repeat-containing protein [Planctomycetota bacterium]
MIALVAPAESFAQGPRTAQVSVFDVGAERRIDEGLEGDVDGDGVDDLVFSVVKDSGGRELVVLRARKERGAATFAAPADATVDLTRDVVAFALGDVDAASPGKEIVLFNARGAFLCRPFAAADRRFARLAECEFLWQLADPDSCFACPEALVDLDRDGAPDLELPEPGGYAIARQVRGPDGASTFPKLARLRVPAEPAPPESEGSRVSGSIGNRGDEKSGSIEISFGTREGRSKRLLSVDEEVPAPQIADFDGDGRLDVQAQGVRTMWIWLQAADGGFAAAPQLTFPFPVPADRERRLDASYSSHVLDADHDGHSDVAILAGDKRSEDVRTQFLLFLQGKGRGEGAKTAAAPLFGPKGLPQQLLVLGGFGIGAYFDDLDGDALPDLFVRTVRPDLIDQLRSASSESVDADVLVYKNEQGVLAKKPALSWRVAIPIKEFDLTLRFIGDLDGDRMADLVVRSEPERLRVLAMRRAKDGWQFDPRPIYETTIRAKSNILLLPRTDRAVSDVAVLEDSQVLLIRFP